jgi:hypothetical protein
MVSSNTGAGVYQCSLVNCTVNGNFGGGSVSSALNGCTLIGNTSTNGGGAYGGNLTNCILLRNSASIGGGGVYGSASSPVILNNCLVVSNTAASYGGGAYGDLAYNPTNCVLNNCTLISNSAASYGGGAVSAALNNCTISNNVAVYGGGVEGGLLVNCLLTRNYAAVGAGADGSQIGSFAPAYVRLINCTLSGNISHDAAGAANYSILTNCTLIGNLATNGPGGAGYSTLNNCTLIGNVSHSAVAVTTYGGGGAGNSTLVNCFVISNSAMGLSYGGGTLSCKLTNCLLAFNSSQASGGGDAGSTLINCTVVSNSAGAGGGLCNSTAKNSIIYDNIGGNYSNNAAGSPWLYYCCTIPATNGPGNITNDPAFVNLTGGDFHLQPNSPCINSGNNMNVAAAPDLDGNPRIVGGTVDIGAYEYQTPSSILSYAWAQQYGLPTDGSVDYLDLDGSGMPNWQKSLAGLNPTDSSSVLAMLPMTATNNASGIVVSWDSVNTRMYFLQRAKNLNAQPPFSTIQSNLVGQAGITSFTDKSATNAGPYFYRVGVQ